ncbi:acyl-CoA dehydrogenase family protein [Pseudomonas chlororaphis]|jgi:alkylation response protein AidB-like acyl-CoA dehydrogenase|uniref:Acyl-CoA/acyl-ACP dehydrogenase n=1 Tax=Pseudomonas chlororaphis subsp. aurantiaca TaxID=86192 RepID=A0AAJ1E0W9_9PSED|nr:acyl-CoA dehydrogenase family protein [Pseudomonas chlororaphis]AZD36032.1 Acyl-CoA dehydrogenase [Pseudomonas chlororaphis subsp. aurantiaca]AZD42370.1 Acyl-CoA dehydrogenase [Pseudomonas chlororaphis subsp. aurantiaca]AZD48619.1 Acyl-CoA dehydrogenase [Pseudomonas chlororaphis subsp. aurantiaca]AZD67045.1 Acyl-CoA dehydrogenase [Pseudomonas chlororaphis subsp. aurantiaca]AZD73519.1 Acyl-CoA dehydrogenase [Pseudomonas chlororaphis subsp. aurantiaca]
MSLSSPLPPVLHPVEVADFDALLQRIGQQLGATAHLYDESGAFPRDNFALLHQHGLLALTVPKHLGGGGASLAQARKVISAVAKGEPSTALILVMQYLQHSRLQDSQSWPEALRLRVAGDAVRDGALINALRVEPDLGTPARGGLPATIARRTAAGWRISGRKIYSTGSHGLSWFSVWARSTDEDPLVGAWLVHKDTPGISIVEDWDHLGMRATCSHEVLFDNVLVPLDHAVSVSPWSAPQPELDGEGFLWMAVLLSAVYDGIAQAARDWLVGWLETRKPSNLGAALATLPRFQETVGHIDTLLFANRSLLDAAAEGHTPASNAAQLKYLVTGNAIRAVELAIEASGNPGLSRHSPLQRHYRDVLCGRVHTPQNDAVLQGVGKAVFAQRQNKDKS